MTWQISSQTYHRVQRFLRWVLLLLGLLTAQACLAVEHVTLLLSEDGVAYNEFANQLGSLLGQGSSGGFGSAGSIASSTNGANSNGKISFRTILLTSLKQDDLVRTSGNHLLIAVGTPAMTAMAQKSTSAAVLNVLVPRDIYQKTSKQYGRQQDPHRFSAIYVDQPWIRQLSLIRAALPGRNRIGILLGKEPAETIAGVQQGAKELEMAINQETVTDDAELLPALRRLLNASDVLLAIPDANIYNRNNIPTILLSSYRQKVPLFGFSAAYVKAGALAAVYSTPAQIAQQVSEIILGLPAHGNLPAPQYPRYFSVSVNTQVSRSLSLDIDDENVLARKLKSATERAQ